MSGADCEKWCVEVAAAESVADQSESHVEVSFFLRGFMGSSHAGDPFEDFEHVPVRLAGGACHAQLAGPVHRRDRRSPSGNEAR